MKLTTIGYIKSVDTAPPIYNSVGWIKGEDIERLDERSSKQILGKAWNSFRNYSARIYPAELSSTFLSLSDSVFLPLTVPSESARRPSFQRTRWFNINAVTNSRLTNFHMGCSFKNPPRVARALSVSWEKRERERDTTLENVFCIFRSSRVSRDLEISWK